MLSETTKKANDDVISALQLWVNGIEVINTPEDARITITVSDWAEAKLLSRSIALCVNSYWTDKLEDANKERYKAVAKINTLHANSLSVMEDLEKSNKPTSAELKDGDKPEEDPAF